MSKVNEAAERKLTNEHRVSLHRRGTCERRPSTLASLAINKGESERVEMTASAVGKHLVSAKLSRWRSVTDGRSAETIGDVFTHQQKHCTCTLIGIYSKSHGIDANLQL